MRRLEILCIVTENSKFFSRYDPSALEEDLGDDACKAGDYGIKNLQYILGHFDEWIKTMKR